MAFTGFKVHHNQFYPQFYQGYYSMQLGSFQLTDTPDFMAAVNAEHAEHRPAEHRPAEQRPAEQPPAEQPPVEQQQPAGRSKRQRAVELADEMAAAIDAVRADAQENEELRSQLDAERATAADLQKKLQDMTTRFTAFKAQSETVTAMLRKQLDEQIQTTLNFMNEERPGGGVAGYFAKYHNEMQAILYVKCFANASNKHAVIQHVAQLLDPVASPGLTMDALRQHAEKFEQWPLQQFMRDIYSEVSITLGVWLAM